jgi:protein subunit release factor A
MKDSIRRKLEKLDERYEEIGRLLSEPDVIGRQNQFRDLSMEYSRLGSRGRSLSRVSRPRRGPRDGP